MRYVFVFIIYSLCVGASWQFCSTEVFPSGTTACSLNDGETLKPGSSYKSYTQCLECTCAEDQDKGLALYCCGFGINAGVFDLPDDCKVIADDDGCTPRFVKVDDESVPCIRK